MEQNVNTPTAICKARSILAQLPPGTLTRQIQVDMVYRIVNRIICEKVHRDKVQKFNELLKESKLVEEPFQQSETILSSQPTQAKVLLKETKSMKLL